MGCAESSNAEEKLQDKIKKQNEENVKKAFKRKINEIAKPYGFKIGRADAIVMADIDDPWRAVWPNVIKPKSSLFHRHQCGDLGYGRIEEKEGKYTIILYDDLDGEYGHYPRRKIKEVEPEAWFMFISCAKELAKQLSADLVIQTNYLYDGTRRPFTDTHGE